MFRSIKEGIMELMEEHFQAFQVEIATRQLGACTLSFKYFQACSEPEFFGEEGPHQHKVGCRYEECPNDEPLS